MSKFKNSFHLRSFSRTNVFTPTQMGVDPSEINRCYRFKSYLTAPNVQNLFLNLQVLVIVVYNTGLIQAQDKYRFVVKLKGSFTMENVLISCNIEHNVLAFVVHREMNFYN